MSYSSIAACAEDMAYFKRVEAAAAKEGEWQNPGAWTSTHIWACCVPSDIEAAYEFALQAENPNPGGDPGVITDGMILSVVQYLMNPPGPPAP